MCTARIVDAVGDAAVRPAVGVLAGAGFEENC